MTLNPNDGAQEPDKPELSGASAAPAGQDSFMQRANRYFLQLAEKIPEFGGIYLEDEASRLVIRVTEPDKIDKSNVRQIARNYLAAEAPAVGSAVPGGVDAMEILVEDALYTFTELYDWRHELSGPVFNVDGDLRRTIAQKQQAAYKQ